MLEREKKKPVGIISLIANDIVRITVCAHRDQWQGGLDPYKIVGSHLITGEAVKWKKVK